MLFIYKYTFIFFFFKDSFKCFFNLINMAKHFYSKKFNGQKLLYESKEPAKKKIVSI